MPETETMTLGSAYSKPSACSTLLAQSYRKHSIPSSQGPCPSAWLPSALPWRIFFQSLLLPSGKQRVTEEPPRNRTSQERWR